jgi:hypothetical protein
MYTREGGEDRFHLSATRRYLIYETP